MSIKRGMRMPLWASQELSAITGATIRQPWYADGIQIDSREVTVGDLFIALRGSELDGHDFVTDALKRGAVAALIDKDAYLGPLDKDPRLVRVDNSRLALTQLALEGRKRAPAKRIAVTGSAGKTSTVRALLSALSRSDSAHASIRSFNNHVGVPLSLARMPRDARMGIFEVGTGAPGEIAPLSDLVRPSVAIITTVGDAHRQYFPNSQSIAIEKASLAAGLMPGGTAIMGVDHAHADLVHAQLTGLGFRPMTVSCDGDADVRVIKMVAHGGCTCLTADVAGTTVTYKVGIAGKAWVLNSLLVMAATKAIGGDLGQAGLAMATLYAPEGRGRVAHVAVAGGMIRLIDDSYNANPVSMAAALERLSLMQPEGRGRRVALIGDMRELGPASEQAHQTLGEQLKTAGVDWVISYGEMAAIAGEVANVQHTPLKSLEDARALVHHGCRAGDILLVKGSNAAGLGALVQDLLADNRTRATGEQMARSDRHVAGWDRFTPRIKEA